MDPNIPLQTNPNAEYLISTPYSTTSDYDHLYICDPYGYVSLNLELLEGDPNIHQARQGLFDTSNVEIEGLLDDPVPRDDELEEAEDDD